MKIVHKKINFILLITLVIAILNPLILVSAEPQTITIPAEYHPLNESLISVLNIPSHATANNPVPACLIVHGSGGLFSEGNIGENCDTSPNNMSPNFSELSELFNEIGVANIAPSSFVSRDPRFCEDNDPNYFQFVAAPFHNPGDGVPMRDDFYKIRRVVVRTLDMLATYNYLCSLDKIDCSKTCMAGTSNGGTSIMSYIANGLGNHIKEYTNINLQREHESAESFNERIAALSNFPAVPSDIDVQFNGANKPLFASAISPGCSLRKLVPTITASDNDFDPVDHLLDLYYPTSNTELHLEIGTLDDVPSLCYDGGVREIQAMDYETIQDIDSENSQYLISIHENAPHDLLGEEQEGQLIRQKIKQLAIDHFYLIFKNGFED